MRYKGTKSLSPPSYLTEGKHSRENSFPFFFQEGNEAIKSKAVYYPKIGRSTQW
jgi:hypothetical protein